MKHKSTIILTIMIVTILIAGTIRIFTKGLAFDLKLQDTQKVEMVIGQKFEKKDIKDIAHEVFGKQPVLISTVEVYEETASITTTQISNEQKTELIKKINEKYGTDIKEDDVTVEQVSHVRGRDFIKPYIVPFVIATAIILVYLMIRYYKLNSAKVLLQSAVIIALSQLVLLGVIVITRMPNGRYTIPLVLLTYVFSTYICTTKFDKKLSENKVKVEKE